MNALLSDSQANMPKVIKNAAPASPASKPMTSRLPNSRLTVTTSNIGREMINEIQTAGVKEDQHLIQDPENQRY